MDKLEGMVEIKQKYFIDVCMFLSCHVPISEWIHSLYLSECQGTLCSKHKINFIN